MSDSLLATWVNLPEVSALPISLKNGVAVGEYFGCCLSSVFQPIRSFANKRVEAAVAYTRSWANHAPALSPWSLFAQRNDENALIKLDRLCRTIQALNYFSQQRLEADLVVCVHERLLLAVTDQHGYFFSHLLGACGINSRRIAINFPVTVNQNMMQLALAVGNYRKSGFKVALTARNIYEAQQLLCYFHPDILFIDPRNFTDVDSIAEIVKTSTEVGSTIYGKRVETEEQLTRLSNAGIRAGFGFLLDPEENTAQDSVDQFELLYRWALPST